MIRSASPPGANRGPSHSNMPKTKKTLEEKQAEARERWRKKKARQRRAALKVAQAAAYKQMRVNVRKQAGLSKNEGFPIPIPIPTRRKHTGMAFCKRYLKELIKANTLGPEAQFIALQIVMYMEGIVTRLPQIHQRREDGKDIAIDRSEVTQNLKDLIASLPNKSDVKAAKYNYPTLPPELYNKDI